MSVEESVIQLIKQLTCECGRITRTRAPHTAYKRYVFIVKHAQYYAFLRRVLILLIDVKRPLCIYPCIPASQPLAGTLSPRPELNPNRLM